MAHRLAVRPLALALALLAGLGTTALPANAWVPNCNNSTVPVSIPVMGSNATGLPDPIGAITVIVRDISNFPINNALIVIDFSECTDMRLCSDPHDPAAIVDCATRTVRKFTGPAGSATFRVVGFGIVAPGSPGSPARCARIYSDGVSCGTFPVSVYDLNGSGLGPADLSAWLADFFTLPGGAPRDDYDGNGTVGPADLSLWLSVFFASGSTNNCIPATGCP